MGGRARTDGSGLQRESKSRQSKLRHAHDALRNCRAIVIAVRAAHIHRCAAVAPLVVQLERLRCGCRAP